MRNFITRTAAVVCALAGSVALAPSVAQAQNEPPITINECTVLQYIPTSTHPYWHPYGPYVPGSAFTDGIRIAFINRTEKTAVRVAFLVDYRGAVQHVIDAGTFSSGTTIDHTFGEFSGYAWLGPKTNVCQVVAVRFSDGSYWHASSVQRRG